MLTSDQAMLQIQGQYKNITFISIYQRKTNGK